MKKLLTLCCMLKKCISLRKFIKIKMGKWSGFDLGKLYLFSHVSKGKRFVIRKHLTRSVHVGLGVCIETGGFSDFDINFFSLSLVFHMACIQAML